MAKSTSPEAGATARVALITAVKSYLGFLVLALLVVEATLGAAGLLAKEPEIRGLALWLMLAALIVLIATVTLLAFKRPEVLMRSVGAAGAAEAERQEFMDRLYGEWAERVDGKGPTALSVVRIQADPPAHSLRMQGTGYDASGGEASFWRTTAIGIDAGQSRLLYYWQGSPLPVPTPKVELEGYGEVTFYESGGVLEGRGSFSDANLADPKAIVARKGVFMQKLTDEEARAWHAARDPAARANWTARKLDAMKPAQRAAPQPAHA